MVLDRNDVIALHGALKHNELVSKHISTESFLQLMNLMRKITAYLNKMQEDETLLAQSFKLQSPDIDFLEDAESKKAFIERIQAIQTATIELTDNEIKFIPQDNFKKWVDNCPTQVALTLGFFLLKDNNETPV